MELKISQIVKVPTPPKEKISLEDLSATQSWLQDEFSKAIQRKLKRGQKFDVDDENREVITTLFEYFSRDPAFETSKIVTDQAPLFYKSICLMGNVGSGKSMLLEAFSNIPCGQPVFRVVEAGDIADAYSRKGPEGLDQYLARFKTGFNGQGKPNHLLINDLGTELPQRYFGGPVTEVLSDVIFKRELLWKDFNIQTHYTTNLSKDQLREKYYERCSSRLLGMVNLILLGSKKDSKDRRKF